MKEHLWSDKFKTTWNVYRKSTSIVSPNKVVMLRHPYQMKTSINCRRKKVRARFFCCGSCTRGHSAAPRRRPFRGGSFPKLNRKICDRKFCGLKLSIRILHITRNYCRESYTFLGVSIAFTGNRDSNWKCYEPDAMLHDNLIAHRNINFLVFSIEIKI